MMFNGAKKYGPKMFDRVMEANGGSNNAYTSENITVYTDWFPSSSIEVMFDLEADRIAHLNFDDKMIESERGVILSERSTGLENSNWRSINGPVKAAAFYAHPYRWSVIGYESDIKNWTKEDLQNYFRTYYAPNNCTLVVVGDVTLDQIKKLSKKYFEPIPAQDPPRPIHTVEPPQTGEKRVEASKQVSSPNILIAYHIPETADSSYYALSMLDAVLSAGKSSRLYRRLVDQDNLVTDIITYMPFSIDPNLFNIYAILSKDVTTDQVELAIYDEISKIVKDGIEEKELQKVKNQKLMEFYTDIETINGKANNLGIYQTYFGSYEYLFDAPQAFNKVTSDDVKRVAAQFLIKTNRTVGILSARTEDAQ
jgi:predicted Zn-dependent peptidase